MAMFAHQLTAASVEIGLFAGTIFLLFGLDDLIVDAMWIAGVGRRAARVDVDAAPSPVPPIAVAIPAWDESAVIGPMLQRLSHAWAGLPLRIYVGVYPNDLATLMAAARVAADDPRIQLVINRDDGATTKGACLNHIWHRLIADRAAGRFAPEALLLHDAEDMVDAHAPMVVAAALRTADYVQLPVVALTPDRHRWIGGHYSDEFAEAHLKDMVVRSGLGAALPTSGVGCAFRVEALSAVAGPAGPFASDSMVEDYELGLRLSARGFRGRFVRAVGGDGRLVATRALFPGRIDASVRQKTRWLRGIALDGWERLGWPMGGAAPRATLWMLWRDRRTGLAALAIAMGYAAMALLLLGQALAPHAMAVAPGVRALFLINLALLGWRLGVRALCTGHEHGWRAGVRAVPRLFVANIILVMTTWRAFAAHMRAREGEVPRWDKTHHAFPADAGMVGRSPHRP